MNDHLHRVIGIDLGTTYSAVAVMDKYNEQAKIIKDKLEGDDHSTPSVVSLNRRLNKAIVGKPAKQNLAVDEENTIIEIKREMGEEFRPETLDKFKAHGSFREGEAIKARFADQWLLPQEISAFILMKMKEIAETEIGEEIRDAVISVPAYFTEKQKKATKEAALLAGLYPRQLIPEPTAAAICYSMDKNEEERNRYLVFDLGGGTFDVSIIEVEGDKIDVIATSGDPRLGGGDFDDLVTQWAVEELLNHHNIDVRSNTAAKAQIKLHAERAKIRLSTHTSTALSMVELNPQQPPTLTLERIKFEELIDKILKKSLSYVEIALKAAKEKKGVEMEEIDAIILVGGSSKIPKVREMLLSYFGKDEKFVRSEINPDEVVARGAAILAFSFAPTQPPFNIDRQDESTLMNVDAIDQPNVYHITEHSLGVEVQDKRFVKIVDQGTNIPIEVKKSDFTNAGPSNTINVNVYQGEGEYVYENTLIGNVELGPMEPKPAGFHQFEVTFKLDENGLLYTTIHHLNENQSYPKEFKHKTGVGGDKALQAMHNKLQQLFAKREELTDDTVRPTTPEAETAPPLPPQPSSTSTPVSATGPPQPATAEQATGATATSEPTPGQSEHIVETTVDVPAEYRSLIRRTKKQLLKKPDAELLTALNTFIIALNEGKSEDELINLNDELEDAYLISKTQPN